MKRATYLICTALLFCAGNALATSFIVPTDEELVRKADAIVIGTVEGSYVQENDEIETVYEVRVERAMKGGPRKDELLRVVSPGGFLPGRGGLLVPASAHFDQGDRVLLFLTNEGEWRVTDMTLGKFRFRTSTAGARVLVRDLEDVVGWDHAGRVHRENVRREEGFLRFIGERAAGRTAKQDYVVSAADVTLPPEPQPRTNAIQANAPFPAYTYVDWVADQPVRWPNISAGVPFYKRSDQNIAGAADGGVAAIQSGLAAWNNECGSVINLVYSGQRATPSANHDGVNVVEYNDPQSRVAGSWGGSGTIAITFLSFSGNHTFNGQSWWNITDADVVFQNGFPATHAAFPAAMTHELGHGIGWRHSNQHYADGGACQSAVEECTSAAIMNSSVSGNFGYTLQPWDINAAQSVYPGGTCGPACTPPSITSQPQSTTINFGSSTTLSVTASGTAPLSYQWYRGPSGTTTSPVNGATSSSVTVNPGATTSFWVRVTNACGTANSAAATVTVITTPPPAARPPKADFNGDGRSDVFWRSGATGQNVFWFMNGSSAPPRNEIPEISDQNWRVQAVGDFNGNGVDDLMWRRSSTGENAIWLFNGGSLGSSATIPTIADQGWQVRGAGDFDADGKADLFWRHTNGQNMIYFMNGLTVRSTVQMTAVTDSGWDPVAFGDFNADGREDVFWRRSSTGQTFAWLMNGSTFTVAVYSAVSDTRFVPVGAGDFNADGRDDVFWRNTGTGATMVWFMNGSSVTATNSSTLSTAWTASATGDYDGDGKADVFWYNPSTGQTRAWLMNGATLRQSVDMYTIPTFWYPINPH
ncbi:MAG TPA: FG-GAP-like repeat-containing protein [Thermoanaerobaculia bacterium]|nr:FG-GAP-like repeat-containing protein [Thermoanaerobaculia bacterium]